MPKGFGGRTKATLACDVCGKWFTKDARFVKPKNYCCRKCNPAYSGYGDKLILIHVEIDGDNDPSPQAGYKLGEHEWEQFDLPVGCVLQNDRTGEISIVQSGNRIVTATAWSAQKITSGARIYSTGTAWHEKRMTCPGTAWEA